MRYIDSTMVARGRKTRYVVRDQRAHQPVHRCVRPWGGAPLARRVATVPRDDWQTVGVFLLSVGFAPIGTNVAITRL